MHESYLSWTIATVPTGFFFGGEGFGRLERAFIGKSERSSLHAYTWFIILWKVKKKAFSRCCHWLFCFQSISDMENIT